MAAIAAAVLLIGWLVLGGRGTDGQTAAQDAQTDLQPKFGPAVVDVPTLREQTAEVGHTVYWADQIKGRAIELTVGADNSVQIRYVPEGTEPGAAQPYLTVASWPLADVMELARTATKRDGAMSRKAPDGGLYVTNTSSPNNAYLAQPAATALGEVFAPVNGVAWRTLTSDRVLVLQP